MSTQRVLIYLKYKRAAISWTLRNTTKKPKGWFIYFLKCMNSKTACPFAAFQISSSRRHKYEWNSMNLFHERCVGVSDVSWRQVFWSVNEYVLIERFFVNILKQQTRVSVHMASWMPTEKLVLQTWPIAFRTPHIFIFYVDNHTGVL